MYRESPYAMENEAYVFDQAYPMLFKEDRRMVDEIEHSMNQMSLCTASKQKKQISLQTRQFMSLFRQPQQGSPPDQRYFYCKVCSKESQGEALDRTCSCCSNLACHNCLVLCERCQQKTCKLCCNVNYQTKWEQYLCDRCFQKN